LTWLLFSETEKLLKKFVLTWHNTRVIIKTRINRSIKDQLSENKGLHFNILNYLKTLTRCKSAKRISEDEFIDIENCELVKSIRESLPTKEIVAQFPEYDDFYYSLGPE
jgi:hypothetical protein